MSKEDLAKTILINDSELMDILLGGVYTYEEIGVEGVRRDVGSPTENAFDADGVLLPIAVIHEGQEVPYGNVRGTDFTALSKTIIIHLSQFRGHDQIDLAAARIKLILDQKRLGKSFPIWHIFTSPPIPDVGAIANSTFVTQVWQVVYTQVTA